MSKELVVSSTSHETRVAILDEDKLVEVYIERAAEHALVGSVYKGRVSRVLPGMQSAFVKLGLERDAFLYVSDIIDQTEDIESGALDDEDDLAVASAPSPAPGKAAARDESTAEEAAPPDEEQESSEPAGGRRRRGRRSRRGRGAGSRFPESKFADVKSSDGPAARDDEGERRESRRGRRGEERQPREEPKEREEDGAGDRDLTVLPGESLAKYRGEGGEERPGEPVAELAPVDTDAKPDEGAAESARGGRRRRRRRGRRGGRDRSEGAEETRAESADAPDGSDRREAGDAAAEAEQDEEVRAEEIPAEDSVEADADDRSEDVEETADDSEEDSAVDSDDDEDADEGADEGDEEDVDEGDEEESDDDDSDDDSEDDVESDEDEEEDSDDDDSDDSDREDENEDDSDSDDSDSDEEESDGDDENGASEQSGEAEEDSSDESNRRQPGKPRSEQDDSDRPEAEAGVRGRGGSRYLKRGRRGRRRRGRGGDEQTESRGPSEQERESQPRPDASAGPLISDLLKPGQEVIVQIAKEPLGKKGARITSHIALPGRYLVYMPTVAHVGVSRKISSDAERVRLRRVIRDNSEGLPGGFIVRTAGQGKSDDELIADINFLSGLWKGIQEKGEKRPAPALLHTDLGVVERILRDQLGQSYKTIWVDAEEEYERIVSFLERFQPDLLDRVKLYTRSAPIFDEFKITQEIEKALRPKVWLKSGGYIVINQTEALVAIDVNTGKYVGKSDRLEDTIVKTNLEAVQEIVRQMRLRDLGGIIVVDFIDMDDRANRKKVTAALEKELRYDRSPSKALAFNDFGLVAITRKRVKQSLERALCAPCPDCQGSGYVKSPESVIYEILNDARRTAPTRKSKKDVTIRCHPEVAKRLKSRDNAYLQELEEILGSNVIVRGDPSLYADNFDVN